MKKIVLSPLLVLIACSTSDHAPEHRATKAALADSRYKFSGSVVDTLPSGEQVRELLTVDGRTMTWRRKVEFAENPGPEQGSRVTGPVDLSEASEAELAEGLRLVSLVKGHEFIDAEPNYEAARNIRTYEALQKSGNSPDAEEFFPTLASYAGEAPGVPDVGDDKTIFGTDSRSLKNNLNYPYRTNLVLDNHGGNPPASIDESECTATMVGASTAASAAHCFWDEPTDTWEAYHRFAAGFDSQDGDPSPYGDFPAWSGSEDCVVVSITNDYVTTESHLYDFAVLDFWNGCNQTSNGVDSDEIGTSVGWVGAAVVAPATLEALSLHHYNDGYPAQTTGNCADPPVTCNTRVWGASYTNDGTYVDVNGAEYRTRIDITGGHSGSGVRIEYDPAGSPPLGWYTVAIITNDPTNYNIGRLIDSWAWSVLASGSVEY